VASPVVTEHVAVNPFSGTELQRVALEGEVLVNVTEPVGVPAPGAVTARVAVKVTD
jgi:hypothetical protein